MEDQPGGGLGLSLCYKSKQANEWMELAADSEVQVLSVVAINTMSHFAEHGSGSLHMDLSPS